MQESIYSPLPAVSRLPKDAPNILIVLIDDVGPAQTDTYGGEIHTPTLSRIANEGISYNRFHTTAMCSPTRAALLTGRNHHRVASGQITELANDWDGYMGTIPKSSATVAEVLKDYGYRTAAWGKWHNTPAEQTTAAGPFDYWPTGYGFEYFYGFLAGEASQYEPMLVRNTAYVDHPHTSGGHDYYHLSEDLADDAIAWLRQHKALAPDKPFFMYWASGASHGPHQVPKEWADKYKGKFDDGWDKYRERAFQRAKQLGWIPQNAKLTPRPATLASWDSIPEDEKPFQRRLMEVFAGFTEHVDAQVGRIVDEIDRLGYGENTLILYIWGDNGASAEGQNGTISELLAQNGIPTTTKQQIKALDALGGLDVLGSPKTDNMYHAGWAWAGGTPYQYTKLIASHFGGTRNPMAVRWPAKIKPDATPRAQFLHVNDVVPTIYDILGITPPRVVNGIPQDPFDGVSFTSTFNDAKAKEVKHTQYFEIMGSRGIYHDGWMASAFGPRTPWIPGLPEGILEWTPDKDKWELYNLDEDWSQANDLAAKMPAKLADNEGPVPDRVHQEQRLAHRRRPVGGRVPPRTAPGAALHVVDLPGRDHADARIRRAGPGQQAQRRHHRRRRPGQCQRRALRARRLLRRPHALRQGRRPVVRVQPVRDRAHPHQGQGQAAHRQGEDRGRDLVCRAQAGRPAEGGPEGQRQGSRLRRGAGQRAAGVHRQRRPRLRHRPRLAGGARVLRPGAVQVQRHDRAGPRGVHEVTAARGVSDDHRQKRLAGGGHR